MFGPYDLIESIGRGAMGEVWRAADTGQGNRIVAVKVLHDRFAGNESYARRFRRESEVVAALSSPHIVPVHRYGEIDGRLYIDMALVDGIDLGALLAHERVLPADRAVALVEQVARALGTAHRAGLAHRDVKPSNILVEHGAGHVYLIDFGMSRWIDTDAGDTASVGMIGNLGYTAPERFDGVEGRPADIYALGAVLHHVLTGAPPFPDTTDRLQLMNAHQHAPVPRTSELAPGIPAAVDEVVGRALAKAPDQRYSLAMDLAVAARAALAAPPPAPAAPPVDPRPQRVRLPDAPPVRADPTPDPGRPVSRRRIVLAGLATVAAITGLTVATRPRPVLLRTLRGHDGRVSALVAPVVGGRPVIASTGTDGTVRTWDTEGNVLVVALEVGGTDGRLTPRWLGAAEIGGAPVLLAAGPLGVATIAVPSGERVSTFEHVGSYTEVVTTADVGDRSWLVAADRDVILTWDVESAGGGGPPFGEHRAFVTALSAGRLRGDPVVLSGDDGGVLGLSSPVDGAPIWLAEAGHDSVSCTAAEIGPGTAVASGGGDGTIRIRDRTTGALFAGTDAGHAPRAVTALVGAEVDGVHVLVSGGDDSLIRIWDLATCAPLGEPLAGHSGGVAALATTLVDGTPVLVSGGGDGVVRIWDLRAGLAGAS